SSSQRLRLRAINVLRASGERLASLAISFWREDSGCSWLCIGCTSITSGGRPGGQDTWLAAFTSSFVFKELSHLHKNCIGKLSNCRSLKYLSHRNADAEFSSDFSNQPDAQQRMASKLKEAVMDTHLIDSQDFGPDCSYTFFHFRSRFNKWRCQRRTRMANTVCTDVFLELKAIHGDPLAGADFQITNRNNYVPQRSSTQQKPERLYPFFRRHHQIRQSTGRFRGVNICSQHVPGIPVNTEPVDVRSAAFAKHKCAEILVGCSIGSHPQPAQNCRKRRHQNAEVRAVFRKQSCEHPGSFNFGAEMYLTTFQGEFINSSH